jgi:hypothetical protein
LIRVLGVRELSTWYLVAQIQPVQFSKPEQVPKKNSFAADALQLALSPRQSTAKLPNSTSCEGYELQLKEPSKKLPVKLKYARDIILDRELGTVERSLFWLKSRYVSWVKLSKVSGILPDILACLRSK